ncbi:MAG: hypothetical protein AB7S78_12335 [Candidatus Omnitrophota bacterium]
MTKFFRTILACLIILSNLDVRILHAQVAQMYTPVLPVTLATPTIINLPLIASSDLPPISRPLEGTTKM